MLQVLQILRTDTNNTVNILQKNYTVVFFKVRCVIRKVGVHRARAMLHNEDLVPNGTLSIPLLLTFPHALSLTL